MEDGCPIQPSAVSRAFLVVLVCCTLLVYAPKVIITSLVDDLCDPRIAYLAAMAFVSGSGRALGGIFVAPCCGIAPNVEAMSADIDSSVFTNGVLWEDQTTSQC